ncbi:MAG TPA: orotate phosphoribosyltransferase [Acidiferrobacteraceae bacterium]|nr:orotate phosphoribosyltransferase [Acidiferrobacteraceae bacterium]
MKDYQYEFLEFALETGVLRFGEFTLKSGRNSPYFFNTGLFNTGQSLASLGRYYARAIVDSGCAFDMLYGPAYKGIPLVTTTAIALAEHHDRDIPYCFNRKEAKDHAEGGVMVGAELSGSVLIVDDVISAGLSIDESIININGGGAKAAGVFVALNRQEKGQNGTQSAARDIVQRHNLPLYNIVNLELLMEFLKQRHESKHLEAIMGYYKQHGA